MGVNTVPANPLKKGIHVESTASIGEDLVYDSVSSHHVQHHP